MGTPSIDTVSHEAVITTNNTPTMIALIAPETGWYGRVTAEIHAYRTSDKSVCASFVVRGSEAATGDCWTRIIRGTIKRFGGAAAALVGANTTENRRDGGAAAVAPHVAASGNDLLVQVSGQAAKTIVWTILEKSVV